jgi:hypothetical protein
MKKKIDFTYFSLPGAKTPEQSIPELIRQAENGLIPPDRLSALSTIFASALTAVEGVRQEDLPDFVRDVSAVDLHRVLRVLSTPPKRRRDMFVFPSSKIMFSILALFAGKPDRIPRSPEKPWTELSDRERQASDALLLRYLNGEDPDGRPLGAYRENDGSGNKVLRFNAFAVNNPAIKGWADIRGDLFAEKEPREAERLLSVFLRDTFGLEGLKHFLALIIQLDESGQTGSFTLDLDHHCDLLGATWKHGGDYRKNMKRKAARFLYILSNLYFTTIEQQGKRERRDAWKLFDVPRYAREVSPEKVTDEMEVRAEDFWYMNAIKPPDGSAPQWVELYKRIAAENVKEHPRTVLLAPLFSIFWRIRLPKGQVNRIPLRRLLEWCDLRPDANRHGGRNLEKLKAELSYMRDRDYSGEWKIEGTDERDSILTIEPPAYLKERLSGIAALPAIGERDTLTVEEFRAILKASGLPQRTFANTIGTAQARVSMILSGKRPITAELSAKVRDRFPEKTNRQEDAKLSRSS